MGDKDIYRWVRTAGFLAIIPIILAGGPIGGYLTAEILIKMMHFPGYTVIILTMLGFAASIVEIVKIIKIALKSGE